MDTATQLPSTHFFLAFYLVYLLFFFGIPFRIFQISDFFSRRSSDRAFGFLSGKFRARKRRKEPDGF